MQKYSLVYFSDAVCVWCYGFGPVLKKLLKNYAERIGELKVVNYGLCPGERALVIDDIMAEYIEIEIEGVTRTTGAEFGRPFFELVARPGARLDSQPAAEALEIVRRIDSDKALDFLHAVQLSHNVAGQSLSDWGNLKQQAVSVGIGGASFDRLVASLEEITETVKREYLKRTEWGVSQAPTLFAVNDAGATKIADGYIDYTKLEENFLKLYELTF